MKNKKEISVTENRQHNSGCLHQPQGGRISKELVSLTRDQWMWCLERNIHIQAQHLPDVLIWTRWQTWNPGPWQTDQIGNWIVWFFWKSTDVTEMDLFASRLIPVSLLLQLVARSICRSNQCIPPGLEDNERLCQPPWNLVSRVQRKAQSQEADVILIASIWKIQPWYPLLLARLVDWPRLLPKHGPVPCQCP